MQKAGRSDSRALGGYALEKALINLIASYTSMYTPVGSTEQLDAEYLLSAVLAGLYHSRNSMDAAGDQLVISIVSH
jgi:hypothetical protein